MALMAADCVTEPATRRLTEPPLMPVTSRLPLKVFLKVIEPAPLPTVRARTTLA